MCNGRKRRITSDCGGNGEEVLNKQRDLHQEDIHASEQEELHFLSFPLTFIISSLEKTSDSVQHARVQKRAPTQDELAERYYDDPCGGN